MKILAVETSCDETSAAIAEGKNGKVKILSNIISSQIKLHSRWGGVVPNLAAREHLKNIVPVIKACLKKSRVKPKDIDLIAVTQGPGLIPALLIGNAAAKTLSYLWEKPLLGIHHIEGHIYANFIEDKAGAISSKNQKANIKFPALCPVVSGGHTQLVFMKNHLDYKIIGETLDDAAGEAFDKTARILGLGYPGGPAVATFAAKVRNSKFKTQNSKFPFPRPMINSKDFNFSFSGLKTAVLYETKKNKSLLKNEGYIAAVCQEFQQAAIDVLIAKTIRAAKTYPPKTIILAGGVSANRELQKQLEEKMKKELPDVRYQKPKTQYSLDNAAMIAAAAYWRFQKEKKKSKMKNNWKKLEAKANWKMA